MLDTYFRSAYQRFLVDPAAKMLVKTSYNSPDLFTYGAGILGAMTAPLLWLGFSWLAALFLLISGYLDTVDGTIARLQNRASERGAVLDIVWDRVVEFAVIFGLFSIDPLRRGWLALGMLGSTLICVTSFLVVGIFSMNKSYKSFHYSAGLMERTEAFVFFIAMMLLPRLFTELASLFVFLVLLTAYMRVRAFRKQAAQQESLPK